MDNRREFIGMFQQLQPLVYQAAPILAGLSAALALACWRRWPRLSIGSLGGIGLTLVYFSFQSFWLLSPHLSDAWAGDYVRKCAGVDDLVVMGNIEEFEYGMSLRYYSRRRVLMVQRQGLPDFGFPLTAQENFLIPPRVLRELWEGPRRVFVLADDCAPEEYLTDAVTLLARGGKRLITNRPFLTGPPLRRPESPLTLEKNSCLPDRGEQQGHDTFTR